MSDAVSHETNCCTVNIAAQIEQKKAGHRKLIRHGGALCSRCLERPPAHRQRYCNPCHAEAEKVARARRRDELTRLRALEQQLSKGKDNGQITKEDKTAAT